MLLFCLTAVIESNQEKLDRDILDTCIYRVAKGDDSAFEELYKRTSTSVYAYALSILKNTFDAQDIMHDTYLHIYSHASAYKTMGKPMAWILTIVKNESLKRIKSDSKIVELDEYRASSDEGFFSQIETNSLLNNCFKILSDEEREIVIMHAVAGFKHREIAYQLDKPLSTILSKYNRAIKKLRDEYEKELNIQ